MADRNSQRHRGTWAFKPSLQDIPLTTSAPIVLKEQVRWSYDWTKPSENFALAVTEFLFSAFLKPPKAMPYGLDRTEFLPKKRYTPVEYIFSFGEYDLQPGLGIYITEKPIPLAFRIAFQLLLDVLRVLSWLYLSLAF